MLPLRTRLALGVAAVVAVGTAVTVGVVTWDSDGTNPATDTASLTRQEYPLGERPPLPPIAGETLDGDQLDLADLRGEVVVINVWGSWCGPCRAEMADLEEVYQATQDQGVAFVGINVRDSRDRARSFAANRVTYPSIFDYASEYALGFTDPPEPPGLPATLVVDRDGNIAATLYRMVGRAELEEIVTRLAGEPGG